MIIITFRIVISSLLIYIFYLIIVCSETIMAMIKICKSDYQGCEAKNNDWNGPTNLITLHINRVRNEAEPYHPHEYPHH